jgi:hypothetical protein
VTCPVTTGTGISISDGPEPLTMQSAITIGAVDDHRLLVDDGVSFDLL